MKTIMRRALVIIAVLAAGVAAGRYAHHIDAGPRSGEAIAATNRPAAQCWEATVFLPLADNSGTPFSESAWDEALAVFVVPFGGATLGTQQEGCWLDAHGHVCREQIRPVVISFPPERLDEFRGAVRTVGQRLGQEAMYVRFREPRVELIPGHGP